MAKKKGALTSPFVPEEEQPYPIPENWCWVRLSSLSIVISKGTTPVGGKTAYVNEGVNFLRVENINEDGSISHEKIAHNTESLHAGFLKRSILQERDILISIAGTLGKTGIVRKTDLPLNTNQAIAFVRLSSHKINELYIKNAIDCPMLQKYLLDKIKVTSIPNLTLEIVGNCPIPFAPLPEQHRIVDRIESLLSKLDEAKEKAQAVVDGFELRKSAILHKAFTGELTERWRKEHGVSVDNWKYRKLSDVATVISGYAFSSDDFDECNDVPCIKITNVGVGNYISENYEYLPAKFLDTYYRFKVSPGDILIFLTRSYIAAGLKVCICNEPRDSLLNQRVALIKNCNTRYIYYYLKSSAVLYYVKEKSKTTNQPNLSIKDLNNLLVLIPVESEQNEIVSVLNHLLDKEEYAKSAAEAVPAQIDIMKKAILARAFRGELGTNDPAEEWAWEPAKATSPVASPTS